MINDKIYTTIQFIPHEEVIDKFEDGTKRKVSWEDAAEISDTPRVHEALQNFADDPTGDNGTEVVRAILECV